jgi:membrane glycosyltransferase
MMLFHSTFVLTTLAGRSVSWNAQPRSDRGVTLREAFQRQKWHLVAGLVWGAVMARVAPQFFWWLTPVLLGLILSIGLTTFTSRTSAGTRLRKWHLLLTPEESAPPPELVALARACATGPAQPAPQLVAAPAPDPIALQPVALSGAIIDSKETHHDAKNWIPEPRRAAAGGHPGVGGQL